MYIIWFYPILYDLYIYLELRNVIVGFVFRLLQQIHLNVPTKGLKPIDQLCWKPGDPNIW